MKLGIITSGKNGNVSVLFHFLIHKSFKPDYLIYVNSPIYKRIKRNFNWVGIKKYILVLKHFLYKKTQEPERDYLQQFIKEKNIFVPEITLFKACQKENVKYKRFNNINSWKAIKYIKELQMDIMINAGAGILRSGIINSVNIGILNAHMGYLPDFRGMNVLEWSLLYNREIGVTLHFIDPGIDTGDILLFRHIPVEKGDNIEDLRNKSVVINLELFVEGIEGLKNGTIPRKRQMIDEGKQYFVMHPRLKMIVEEKLKLNLDFNQ